MAGIGIESTTIGYSTSGALAYINKLNTEAIDNTCVELSKYQGILDAIQAGWQGKAEENFEANFKKLIDETQTTIRGMQDILESQFSNLEEAWKEQDENMVPLD